MLTDLTMQALRTPAMLCTVIMLSLLTALVPSSALHIPALTIHNRKLFDTNVSQPQVPQPQSGMVDQDNVLKMNCSGWPEPRRYLEVASWWTPESVSGGPQTPSGSSHRVSVGACVPSGIIRATKLVVDVGIKLANCITSTRYVNSIWINLFGVAMAREEGLGFYCCGLSLCQQTIRYKLDLTLLGRNGNGTWEMGLQLVSPSTDRLDQNNFANAEISLPATVILPTLNYTTADELSSQLQVSGWGHGPWKTHYINLNSIPSAIWPAYGNMLALPIQTYKWPDATYSNEQASNITSFVVSLNPTLNSVVGSSIMQYSRINIQGFYETPFIDATDTSNLSNGINLISVRTDSYIPTSAMPHNSSLPAVQRTGGTMSVSFTLGWRK